MLDPGKGCTKVVGTKQTLKMVKNGKAETVYLANDVDQQLFAEVEKLCKQKKVPIVYVNSMEELGKTCGINRKAASAAIVTD